LILTDLMGIPSYFAWLVRHFEGDIVVEDCPFEEVHNFYLDWNCGIHPAARSRPESTYEEMYEAVIKYLEHLIDEVKPTKLLYIAIDGVAPLGKMKQQHTRRFKAIVDTRETNALKKQYGVPLDEKNQKDFNAISPATIFMEGLSTKIKAFLQNHKQGKYKHLNIILSDATVPQEGEHKILAHMKTQPDNCNCATYGLDSDLIMLSLGTNRENITLVRENTMIKGNHIDLDKETFPVLNYFLISGLRKRIGMIMSPWTTMNELEEQKINGHEAEEEGLNEDQLALQQAQKETFFNTPRELNNVIRDYIVMSFFLGNDFLPSFESLKIRENGISHILRAYKRVVQKRFEYLVNDDLSLNTGFFLDLIKQLAKLEERQLKHQKVGRDRRIKASNAKAQPTSYKEAVDLSQNVEILYQDTINVFAEGWQDRYYQYFFHPKSTIAHNLQIQKDQICADYIKTVHWITKYYFEGCPDWHYYYPHEATPLLSDLVAYLTVDPERANIVQFMLNEPVNPFHQLLMILPPQSSNLLPAPYARLMLDDDSPLIHYFPRSFEFEYYGKRFQWESHPKIPMLDPMELKQHLGGIYDQLTEAERSRCQRGTPIEF